MEVNNILFVCTGNTCRSPMAEGLALKLLGDKGIKAASGGLSVFSPEKPGEYAIAAAKRYGADISSHIARMITEDDVKSADIVLTMTGMHRMMLATTFPSEASKIHTMYEFAENDSLKDVSDPYGGSREVYEECCDELYALIRKIGDKI